MGLFLYHNDSIILYPVKDCVEIPYGLVQSGGWIMDYLVFASESSS